jgi:hypothetical protein
MPDKARIGQFPGSGYLMPNNIQGAKHPRNFGFFFKPQSSSSNQ